MSSDLDPNQLRRDGLTSGFQRIAAAMLREREPSNEDLGLVCAALASAALAGDRDLLAVVPRLTDRLRAYLPEAAWRSEWEGRLWTMDLIVGLSRVMLAVEFRLDEEAGDCADPWRQATTECPP